MSLSQGSHPLCRDQTLPGASAYADAYNHRFRATAYSPFARDVVTGLWIASIHALALFVVRGSESIEMCLLRRLFREASHRRHRQTRYLLTPRLVQLDYNLT